MRNTRLTPVGEMDVPELVGEAPASVPRSASPAPSRDANALIALFTQALSQRSAAVISALFTLILAGSAFWLWRVVMPAPSGPQLIGLAMYACFVLALEFVRRR